MLESYLSAGRKAVELPGWLLHEIILFYVKLTTEGYLAGSGHGVLGVVYCLKVFHFVLWIVGNYQSDRI